MGLAQGYAMARHRLALVKDCFDILLHSLHIYVIVHPDTINN